MKLPELLRLLSVYSGRETSVAFWHIPVACNVAGPVEGLGAYYIDFSRKVEEWRGLDAEGVPVLDYCGAIGEQYNPTAVAQYALGAYERHLRTGEPGYRRIFLRQADWLAANLRPRPKGFAVWEYTFDVGAYGLKAPWISALAQGQGVSVLLRAHALTGEERYLSAARGAFASFNVGVEEGGVRYVDPQGNLFLEEAPSQPPSCILDGFIFSLFGVYDFWLASGEAAMQQMWEAGLSTLENVLPRYDLGFWSRGDLFRERPKMVASRFYHRLHVFQLQALHAMTGREIFRQYAQRWKGYEERWACRTAALACKALFKLSFY